MNQLVKNFENWSTFAKVIIKHQVAYVFGIQCSFKISLLQLFNLAGAQIKLSLHDRAWYSATPFRLTVKTGVQTLLARVNKASLFRCRLLYSVIVL